MKENVSYIKGNLQTTDNKQRKTEYVHISRFNKIKLSNRIVFQISLNNDGAITSEDNPYVNMAEYDQ